MALTEGWQQYASTAPIVPIDKAFPLAAPGASASTTPKPTGMDPFSAVLGVAGLGTSIAGMFGQQSAAQQQAKAVEDAAAAQLKEAKEAAERNVKFQLTQVGLNLLENRYKGGPGAALDRINAARDYVQRANIEANNPSVVALRSVQSYEDRLRGAMPGYTPPNALFV